MVNIGLSLISIILVLLLAEIGYRGFLIHRLWMALPPGEQPEVCTQYDRILGWRHIPGKVAGRVVIDCRGFRVADESRINAPLKNRRICACGDSFTYGDGMRGSQAWPAKLEEKLPRDGYSVVNMGVCAYGVDQMYLLYQQEKERLDPELVLVGLISWDLQRVVRSCWKDGERGKPRFVYEGGQLKLGNVPVPLRLKAEKAKLKWHQILFDCQNLYLVDRFLRGRGRFTVPPIPEEAYRAEDIEPNKYAEGIFLSQRIIERWKKEAEDEKRRFILVCIPGRKEVDYYHSYMAKIMENLRKVGVEIVDCQPAFQAAEKTGVKVLKRFHPSTRGHEIIATEVYNYLRSRGYVGDHPGTI